MALLAIAAGAIRVGAKILAGVRKRKEHREEKREARRARQEAQLAQVSGLLAGGRDEITKSGNALVTKVVPGQASDESSKVDVANEAESVRDDRVDGLVTTVGLKDKVRGAISTVILIVVGLVLFIIFRKKR
jgi:hypothetical protein